MKTIQLIILLVLSVLNFTSFKTSSTAIDDGYYAFIVVDGIYKNGVGYTSRIIHFPGYSSCNQTNSTYFFSEARRAFSDHLKAYHTDAFPYGENNNFKEIYMNKHSTSQLLKNRSQAEQRMTEWIAEQKEKGYTVQTTTFSYSCDNL